MGVFFWGDSLRFDNHPIHSLKADCGFLKKKKPAVRYQFVCFSENLLSSFGLFFVANGDPLSALDRSGHLGLSQLRIEALKGAVFQRARCCNQRSTENLWVAAYGLFFIPLAL